jgi:hypothetical protein
MQEWQKEIKKEIGAKTVVSKVDYLNPDKRMSDISRSKTSLEGTDNAKVRFNEEVIVNEFSCRSSTDVSKELPNDSQH